MLRFVQKVPARDRERTAMLEVVCWWGRCVTQALRNVERQRVEWLGLGLWVLRLGQRFGSLKPTRNPKLQTVIL